MSHLFYFYVLLIVHFATANPAVSGSEANAVSILCSLTKRKKLNKTMNSDNF